PQNMGGGAPLCRRWTPSERGEPRRLRRCGGSRMTGQMRPRSLRSVWSASALAVGLMGAGAAFAAPPTQTAAPPAGAPADIAALKAKAEAGDAVAELNLGLRYEQADGLPKDLPRAVCWVARSAEHGYISAWLVRGMHYTNREVGPPDLVEAYKWFYLV